MKAELITESRTSRLDICEKGDDEYAQGTTVSCVVLPRSIQQRLGFKV